MIGLSFLVARPEARAWHIVPVPWVWGTLSRAALLFGGPLSPLASVLSKMPPWCDIITWYTQESGHCYNEATPPPKILKNSPRGRTPGNVGQPPLQFAEGWRMEEGIAG